MKYLTIFFLYFILFENCFADNNCAAIKKKYSCPGDRTFPIHLTFDDGPAPGRTELVLDALKKHNVTATFFVMGDRLDPKSSSYSDENIRILRRTIDEGHLIGSHGYHHEHHSNYNKEKLVADITKAKKAGIGVVVDGVKQGEYLSKPLLYRLPYGDGWHPLTENPSNSKMVMETLNEFGFTHVGWPIKGKTQGLHISDWSYGLNYKDLLLKRICSFEGGIVLMHDIQPHTAKGIDEWITAVKCVGHPIVDIAPFLKNSDSVQVCDNVEKMEPPTPPKETDSIFDILDKMSECDEEDPSNNCGSEK